MTRESFGAWMRRQQHRDDPVGDLARDLEADPLGPADERITTVFDYVASVGSDVAVTACIAASREWSTR